MFIIFKLPRTGSSNLAYALNSCDKISCKHEMFNKVEYNFHDYQQFVDNEFKKEKKKIIGFSVNPFKHKLKIDFYKPKYNVENIIFSLTRNIFEQTVSRIISRKINFFPKNNTHKFIDKIYEYLKEKIEIDIQEFEENLMKNYLLTKKLIQFSENFSNKNKIKLIHLNYERLYKNKSDIQLINNILKTNLDEKFFDAKLKVLPDDLSKILQNYNELDSVYQKLNQDVNK